jgi:hypothetical protein
LVAFGVVRRADGGRAATEDKPNVLIKANIDEGVVSAVEISALSKPVCLTNRLGLLNHKSGDRYVKATLTIDPLLERYPTGSKAPAARPQLPTFGYSWGRASEIRAERELMGSLA